MFAHTDRPMKLTTPLGEDALLLIAVRGREAISELFHLELETLWQDQNKPLPFDQLLGQKIEVEIAHRSGTRYFNGIAVKITQGGLDQRFIAYRVEVVPQLWLLTRRQQSRIFQHKTIPDILKEVLQGLDVAYEIQGDFEPRDYCVQYRETDFNFASRLMEEEGIYYFFKHSKDGHKLVLANTPQSHPAIPYQTTVVYEEASGHSAEEDRVYEWLKAQEIRSGKYVTWDECFQMPDKHLEAQKTIMDSVTVGRATHKLNAGGSDALEIYDFPGSYAERFDDVTAGGGDQAAKLQNIFSDNVRTVGIRMQQEALPSLLIHGRSGHAGFTSGHTFDLTGHFSDDSRFAITSVEHDARQPADPDDLEHQYEYNNRFQCIPMALPFRPQRTTQIPSIAGVQTATVVGPPGEEIFTDKYGRVKVQFHWDRQGKNNADSSCWIRVGTFWAGKQWGAIHIPRIGQEVIVDFLEGDPDNPIIVGSVYNADQTVPYTLPDEQTKSTLKSMSSKGGDGFNEIRLEDKKGKEQVFIHGEKDLDVRIKNDRKEWIGQDRSLIVIRDKMEQVKRDSHIDVTRDQIEKIGRDHHVAIDGKAALKITGSNSVSVTGDVIEEFKGNHSSQVTQNLYLKAMQVVIEAATGLTLKVGGNFITIDMTGIAISGMPMVQINSAGAALSGSPGSLVSPLAATAAQVADKADPGALTAAPSASGGFIAMSLAGIAAVRPSPASSAPTHDPNSEENKDKKHWIEIELKDEAGRPVPGEAYKITLPDGTTVADGTLDEKGHARVENVDPGNCKVTFPNLDQDAWEPK